MRAFVFLVMACLAGLPLESGRAAAADPALRPALLFDVDQPIPDSGQSFQAMAAAGARAFTSLTGRPVAEIVR